MEIKGSQFLITGANRGIGLAVARMAAKEGAHLHLVIRKTNHKLQAELKDAGAASVHEWLADLSSSADTKRLVEELKHQPIDILFNNAGQLTGGLLERQPLDDIYSMFQVNLLSLVQLTQGLLPGMLKRKRGKIINNSSVSAFMHFPCASTYAASKAAVWAFTDCLQAELSDSGVSTLCLVTPGIKTRMFDEISQKYGANVDVPSDSISPEAYAERIRTAILKDEQMVLPSGTTGIGLFVARYIPALFRREVVRRFQR